VKQIIPVLIVAVTAAAAGCGGETTMPKPVDCTSVADTTQPATVSFQNDIRPLFLADLDGGYGCGDSDCHGGILISSDYSVDTYESLLEQGEQARDLGICSIKPGDPDASYFYRKLSNASGIAGVPMPFGKPLMDQEDRETVRVWILEGARNN
jgi:hypothetical protein